VRGRVKTVSNDLRVSILGSLKVWRDGHGVAVAAGKPSVVLAVLAAAAGQPVSVSALVRYVWEDKQPKRPSGAIQGLVLRLRQSLGASAIVTVAHGYLLDVDPDQVDLTRFRRLIGEAGQADAAEAGPLLEAALALWRGEPFQGLDSDLLRREYAAWLLEERLMAIQQRIDLELAADRPQHVVSELRALTSQYPLRETLWRRLILALAGDSRYAEAVAAYHEVRAALRDQLGVNPSAELQAVYHELLAGESTRTGLADRPFEPDTTAIAAPSKDDDFLPGIESDRRPPARPALPRIPRQLPTPPVLFVGRKIELARLSETLQDGDRAFGAAVIAGAGGLGKTWLALRWSHENINRFPDGQLYVDLRGYDPSESPTQTSTALRGFLEALGVDRESIPLDLDAQAGLYRSLTSGRRILVLLDNALDTEHVKALLPDTRSCTVLVTGRHEFGGLVTAYGAHRVALDALDASEALELLTRRLEPAVVAADPGAITELLGHCAGLPLAISIVAARAANQPTFPLGVLADELSAASTRLDALSTNDLGADLRAVFATSHRTMNAAEVRAFGLLGLAPTSDTSVAAAAALTGLPTGRIRVVLRELEAAHLISQYHPGRYRMHDLIRLYAAETAPDDDEALPRLVDFYLHTAYAGERRLDPHRVPIELEQRTEGCDPLELPDRDAALRWFDAEHVNVLAVLRLAGDRGWHGRVWQLAWSLGAYSWRRGDPQDNLTIWQAGLAAAVRLDAADLEADAHRRLGLAAGRLGDFDAALDQLQQSVRLAEQVGDLLAHAHAEHSLAWVRARQGDDRRALKHAVRALELTGIIDDPLSRANAFSVTGWYYARVGDHEQAERHCRRALELFGEHDDPEGQADTLDSLGLVAFGTGRYTESLEHYQRALALFRDLGHRYEEANTLASIGDAHHALGHGVAARRTWHEALNLYHAQCRPADMRRVQDRLTLTVVAAGSVGQQPEHIGMEAD
jgi:DNA-binding SARP family transcriptional activator